VKYYHVRVNNQNSQELVVIAANPDDAKRAAAEKLHGGTPENVKFLREDVSASVDVSETIRAGWLDACSKEEESKNNEVSTDGN
jgi:stalled ribosome rescue protein Dom34